MAAGAHAVTEPTARAAALSGPQKALRKLGLLRPIDLALHLPLRYEDQTRITPLAQAQPGQTLQLEGTVRSAEVRSGGRRQLQVLLDDGSGCCTLLFFHFSGAQHKALAPGTRIRARGELRHGLFGPTLLHPQWQRAEGELPRSLTPVYPASAGLPQAYLRRAIASALERADLSETVPPQAWADCPGLAGGGLRAALLGLHQPPPEVALASLEDRSHPAWQRLKAEELLAQQLAQWQARQLRAARCAPEMAPLAGGLHAQLLARLPFALTAAQRRVGAEIDADLQRRTPMHRLLQGDVGSGKTVVAALAAARAIDAGWQCALMAPTEILAEQHFGKLIDWLQPLLQVQGRHIAWLTGSQNKGQRTQALAGIHDGRAALVVGTHAVIGEQVQFARLGLALIDEQHRFGVAQRLALRSAREGVEPHLLMMSATPIPRTLAMSHYADLDISSLDELPPGRSPILTKLLSASRRDELLSRLRAQLAQGRQAYWVCPLIEDSEALDLRNAQSTALELAAALEGCNGPTGAPVQVGLLHARLPLAEKKEVMARFCAGQIGVLVSTTVVEVGVDVPNATLMVIEHAERFGLSQLHQLRGRVGRGQAASVCVLFYEPGENGRLGEAARARLRAMLETADGFEIARRDLEIRGPGEFLGARQSGAPMLRFADLEHDAHLLDWARAWAPRLLAEQPQAAQRHIERWLGAKSDFLKA
ncbi:ATP-dependent DNA helicase RecG [Serpentinimonas maccroryi]|uniref:ATP-dependent DNA helicase RecG n=1 Tax=Serpentinimonas maccroryi TaxID=1458426 RepID=UPI002033BE65|nr:ATP-dependent DNA helicase RecG [Serpentinimonas maccroryi]MCM2479246.1 ATP-dependent DNA helicase RecG [Serpentinimonas maccroryi]